MSHQISRRIIFQKCLRPFSNKSSSTQNTSRNTINPDVPGLSDNCLNVPSTPVGAPGAAKSTGYKNPEYFCYHVDSFAEAEVEMAKFRLPAPSNKVPFDK